MMNEKKPSRFVNTKVAVKTSMNKQIDGKTLIAIVFYVMYFAINKVIGYLYPTEIPVFWLLFGDLIVGVVVWVICLLFNIDNPSVGQVFRDIGVWLMDLALDPEDAINELRIWYAALGQRYMIEFDKLGEKIKEGVIKVQNEPIASEPTPAEIIKKKMEESKTGTLTLDGHGNPI